MAKPARKTPVYEDIKRLLRTRIENGELVNGERVPSEYELARQLGVSRHRTRQALRELEVEGYVLRRRGSGTYVAPVPSRISIAETGMANTVVISFPKFESKYARRVVEGFMAYMGQAGIPTIAYHLHSDHESEVQALRSVVDSGVNGLVAWLEHDTPTMRAFLGSLRRRRFPIVLADRYFDGVEVDYVVSANEEAGYALTKALLAKGHSRIAFAGYKPKLSSVVDRFRGYERAIREANAARQKSGLYTPPMAPLAIDLDSIWADCRGAVRDVMAQREKPTAFMCMHDKVMAYVHREIMALGYSTPDEVAFASVQDMHPAGDLPPVPLATTAAQNAMELGSESARVLRERIANPDAPVQQISIRFGPLTEERETAQETGSISA